MENSEATLSLLRHISAQLDALPGRLAVAIAAERRGKVSDSDRALLDLLLQPLLNAVRESMFTLHDLDEHARLDSELRTALDAAEAKGVTRKALGKLLARVEGADLGGAVVWQRRKERDGALWQIQRV
jgi:hypothetical protein